jgi:hypothetical protein
MFPAKTRFSFGQRIEGIALDVVEDLVEARYSREKRATLRRANLRLEKLRVLSIRLLTIRCRRRRKRAVGCRSAI